MAGKIPQPFIDQVLNQTDIVDLISSYIDLKSKGKEFSACCPFHGEKTPSFTVSPEKQFYHCFGCGAHGTAISFLMEHEGLQFVEAIEVLASRLGLDVLYEQGAPQKNSHQILFDALSAASKYYQKTLRTDKTAVEYLKSRGISGEIAADFEIGFAPKGFDNIKSHLEENFSQEDLVSTGLLSKKAPAKVYDRFRNRIMFPIKDTRGRVIAFGGRAIDDSMPKYINSPETELFHKGSTLYGLYEARKAMGKIKQLIIVEGYMDVVALAQHGVKNSIATLGTATTSQNIQNLLRFCSQLVFCFDGDRAGYAAAWKALEQILPEYKDGIEIRFAFMPQGEDPDSLIRSSGKNSFQQYIQNASPLSEFFFAKICKEIDTSTSEGKDKLASIAKPLLNKLPKIVFRDLMYKELNERIGTTISNHNPAIRNSEVDIKTSRSNNRSLKYTKTRLAVALILREPALMEHALPIEDLRHLEADPGIGLLIELLEIISEDLNISSGALIERFHARDEYAILQKLIMWDPPDMGNRESSFIQTMERFKEDIRRVELDAIINQEN
jgi:DNA primase